MSARTLAAAEPVAVGAGILATTQAFLAVLLVFEIVDWTPVQVGTIQAFLVALVGAVAAVVRSKVTPAP